MNIETAEQLRAALYVKRVMERTGIIRNIALTHKDTSLLSNMINDLNGTGATQDTLIALGLAYHSGCYQHIVSVLFKVQSVLVSVRAACLAGKVCDETTLERALDVLSKKARNVLLRSVKNHKRTEAAEYLMRIIIERYGYKEALILLPACSDTVAVKYLPEFINFAPQVMKDKAPRLARIKSLLPLLTEHKLLISPKERRETVMKFTRSMIDWPIEKLLFHCNQSDKVFLPRRNFFQAMRSDRRAKLFNVLLTIFKNKKLVYHNHFRSFTNADCLVKLSKYISCLPGLENRRITAQRIIDLFESDMIENRLSYGFSPRNKREIKCFIGYITKNEEDIKNAIELVPSAEIRSELANQLIKVAGISHNPQNLINVIEYCCKRFGRDAETLPQIISALQSHVPGWLWDPLCLKALVRFMDGIDTNTWHWRGEEHYYLKLSLYKHIFYSQGHYPYGASTEEVKVYRENMYCGLIRLTEATEHGARNFLFYKYVYPNTDPSLPTSLENREPFVIFSPMTPNYTPGLLDVKVKKGDCGIGRRRIYRWIEFVGLRLLETMPPITVPSIDPNNDDQHICTYPFEYTVQVRAKFNNWYKTYIHVYRIYQWVFSAYSVDAPRTIPKGPLGDWLHKLSGQAIQQAKDIQPLDGPTSLCHFDPKHVDGYGGCQWDPCKALSALFNIYLSRDLDQCAESLIHTKHWMAWSSIVTDHICDPNGSPHLLDALLDMVGARMDSGQYCPVLWKKGFGHWSASQEIRYKCMLLDFITSNYKGDCFDKAARGTFGFAPSGIEYAGDLVCALTSMLNTTLNDLLPFLPDPERPETILTLSNRGQSDDSKDCVNIVAAAAIIQKNVLLKLGHLDQPQLTLSYVLSAYTSGESDCLSDLWVFSCCSLETVAQRIPSSFLLPIIKPVFEQCAVSANKGLLRLIIEHSHPQALPAYILKILEDTKVHRDVKNDVLNVVLTNNTLAAYTAMLIDMCLEISRKVVDVIEELQSEKDLKDMDSNEVESIEEEDRMRLSSAIIQQNIFYNCVISGLPVLLADTIRNIQIDLLLADISTMPFKVKALLGKNNVRLDWTGSNPCVLAVTCQALQSTITNINDTRIDSDTKKLLELEEKVKAVEWIWWTILKRALQGVEPKGGYEPFQSLLLCLNGHADSYTSQSPYVQQQAIEYKQPLMITRLHRACALLAGTTRRAEGDEALCNLAMKMADNLLSRPDSYIEALALITRAVPTHNIYELRDNNKVEETALKHISIFLNALDQCGGIMHDEELPSRFCSHVRVIYDAIPETYGDLKKLSMVMVKALSKNMDNRDYRLASLFIVQQLGDNKDDWNDFKFSSVNIISGLTKDKDNVVSQKASRLLVEILDDATE